MVYCFMQFGHTLHWALGKKAIEWFPKLRYYLIRVSITVIKHHDRKKLGKKRFIISYKYQVPSIIEGCQELKVGTWRKELM